MVMYQSDHPIQWTPAYVGGKVGYIVKFKISQNLISISI